jgi:LPS sulfotransferase NodH
MSVNRFVILAAPRTGSNLLCSLLNSHPQILCHHEVFNPRGIFYALDRRDDSMALGTRTERDRQPFKFLDKLWKASDDARYVGFKMTSGQQKSILRQMLSDDSVQKIVLHRANRVRTYVSHLIAEQTDQWEIYDEAELVDEVPRLRIDVMSMREHAASNASFYSDLEATLRSSGQSWLEILYQDLLRPRTHARLLSFLGAAPVALAEGSVRQNRRDLRSLIDNFEELAAALEETDYHSELLELQEMAHER